MQKGPSCKVHNVYSMELESNSLFFFETKIQAFKDNKRQNMMMPWNNGNPVQFSAPPKMPRNPRKHATGKVRTRWSDRNHRFNPIKTSRFNTMGTKVSDLNKINIVAPTLSKACNGFGPSCLYCKQGAPHPSPQDSNW